MMNQIVKIFLFSAVSAALMSFSSEDTFKKDRGLKWNFTTYNFGDIVIGPDATVDFVFKNKTGKTVKLKSVQPGCSCTISSFTEKAVKNNRSGKITATYKTKDRPGFFKKFIQADFEDGTHQELIITGNVVFEQKK